jgi:hypothetical protein
MIALVAAPRAVDSTLVVRALDVDIADFGADPAVRIDDRDPLLERPADGLGGVRIEAVEQ